MFGVDNTLLSRALEADVFEPYATHRARRDRPRARPRSCRRPRSTPIDFGDVCVNYDIALVRRIATSTRRRRSPTSPRRSTRTCSSSRTRRRRRPASRSCSPRSPSSATTGGRSTGPTCAPTVSRSSTRGRTAYYERFSGSSGGGPATARRQLRHAARRPRSSSPIRRATTRRPPSSPRRASARSSSPACCAAPTTRRRRGAGRLPRRQRVPGGDRAQPVRVPGADRRRAPRGVHRVQRGQPDAPYTLAPADIAEHREEWVDEWTQIVLR